MHNKLYCLILAFCLGFVPSMAWANAGVPMIFLTMPAMLIGLIPIIVIEAYILKIKLGITNKKSLISSSIANSFSTLIGIPITWILLVVIQMTTGGGSSYETQTLFGKFLAVTWQAPWLLPYGSSLDWMIPTAMLVLLIPFFFVSWKIEHFVIGRLNKQIDRQVIKSSCLRANIITYALFSLYPFSLFVYGG